MSNTAVTEAQVSASIPNPPTPAQPVCDVIATNVRDGAVVGRSDYVGSVHSATFALAGGVWLYAYKLDCDCGPNWDVGCAAAGGGLRAALNGCVPFLADFDNDGFASETSFHTTNQSFRPYCLDLRNFNNGNVFSTSAADLAARAPSPA